MINLIKFELYKIFSKKSVRITLLMAILFALFNVVGDSILLKIKGLDSTKDAYKVMKQHEGKPLTEEGILNIDKTIEELKEKERSGQKLTKEELVYMNYLYDTMIQLDPAFTVNGKIYTSKTIKDGIDNLEKENKTNEYEYKNLKYVSSRIDKIENPKYYFSAGWMIPTDFMVIATLLALLVVVGLASIFSDEYQSNTAQVILSCRRGKAKLVAAKIISGLIFTTAVFIIINSMYLLNAMMYDFVGWDKPLELFKYFGSTPFDIRIIDFYISGLAISFVGTILLALLTMLISLLVKNNMISLLLSFGVYYVPSFLSNYISIGDIGKVFKEINIAESMRVIDLFLYPNTYNIFGNPVLYPTILISLVMIFIPVVTCLIRYFGKKQAI